MTREVDEELARLAERVLAGDIEASKRWLALTRWAPKPARRVWPTSIQRR